MVIKCETGYLIASIILIVMFSLCFGYSLFFVPFPKEYLLLSILIHLLCLIWIFGYCISVCKTLTFTREGIEVSIWFYMKFYKWDELKFRKLESYRNYLIAKSETHQPPYVRCVKFYKKNIKNSKYKNPDSFFSMFHPISFNYVNFFDELITEEDLKKYIGTRFTCNEKEFMDNMKKWGVKIVEDL